VTFYDNASNMNNSMQINISIDNTPPNVTNLTVTPNSLVVGSNANITTSVSDVRLNTSSILVEVKHPNGYTNTSLMNGEGLFYNNYTNTSEYGRYNVTIIASDLVGNINNTVKSWFITVMPPYVNQSVNTTANNAIEIDALNEANTTLELVTSNDTTSGTINITMSRDVPPGINRSFALTPFGKYIEVNASESIKNNLTWVKLKFYYTDAELTASGLDENSLKISRYNESGDPHSWVTLAKGSPSWVNDAGVNTANINNYSGYVWANISHLSTFALLGTPTVTTTTTTSSSGGGGGGGGGGVSAENASNILMKEKYDLHIFKDMVTAYRFTNGSNPVKFVNITGNVSAGEINVAVEVLRGTSTLVNISPPGNIYKNINIWVGTSGFAVPRNIQKATVEFSVDRNWITENSITSINLLRYDTASKEWVSLPTNKVRENITEEYYQGETDRFSSFAITGGKSPSPAALSLAPVASPPAAEETPVVKSTQASESSNAPYWTLTLILFVVVVVLAVYIKLKRR
jgi:PGF-pre-PGF domain-containing protein